MDLYSGLPYWIAKNKLYEHVNPLNKNHKAEILIVGTGITGALVAHELCSAGFKCTMVDKRDISTGSSIASTALLQYEIDTPLSVLKDKLDEFSAVKAYESCLESITDIENVFQNIGYNPDFEKVPSVFYASTCKDVKIIENEFEIRSKYYLPTNFLSKRKIKKKYGFSAPAAIDNDASAQIDAYDASTHLIDYHIKNNQLEVFSHTEIIDLKEEKDGYKLKTDRDYHIKCKYLIIAAGFESGAFLPKKIMKLTSTYAIISYPIKEELLWHGKALIWETANPYLYIRTDRNRIIVGGEDEDFRDPVKRDKLLRKKVGILEKKIHKLFPDIPFVTDMAWCGTFSSTSDGLPYIGNLPGNKKLFYALGYGGNGITFSMIAAQVIKNKLLGIKDEREKIFGFERESSQY